MCTSPAPAPFNVIPRMKNIVSTMYGNNDVKYTTWNKRVGECKTYANCILDDVLDQDTIKFQKQWLTLPELCMPFITIKKTMAHAASKHKTIHHLRPPLSSIDGDASNVVWYQKYVVGDLHSGSVIFSVTLNGQDAHGSTICVVWNAEK